MYNRVRMGLVGWLLPVLLAVLPAILPAQQAENGTIAGKVTSEGSDQPVAAAQVGIASLNVTAVTGADGSYILPGVKPGTYVLQVIRIGFRAKNLSVEVRAGATTRTDLKMNEAALALDAIVVTGTVGQASVRSVGNSISQLNVGKDVKQPVQTLETLLQGRSAGIVIPTGRADMGSGQAIRLRGNASLSLTSYPLIYIDGIRQTGEGYSGVRQGGQPSMLNDIDPSTIDRVEIVKGPAATALYGTEAAAGVIQIFTNLFAFKDRYFVTVGARVDGNSAFGKDLGLQTYPKASASYVVSEEPFFPDALGTWKLRAAYGWAGRAPGAFDATQTWTPLLFTGGGGTAFIPSNPGNAALGPERSREFEMGFDASLFQDRLTADVSWYNRVTQNALLNVTRPASLGNTNSQLENVGEFLNRGLEVGATGIILSGQNLGFEIQATMATNFSEVTAVGTATVNNVQVGYPAPVVRATKVAGSLGGDMYSFEDPIQLPDSQNFYGPNLPTHTFTLAPTFRGPKGITLTLRGEYQKGSWVGQGAAHFLAQRGPYGTASCDAVYRIVPWDEYDGPRTMYGNVAVFNTHANLGSVNAVDRARCYRRVIQGNLFQWPGDFFKVREITLQAPLPFRIPRVQSAVLTLSARNLFTRMSKYNRSQDPDAGSSVEGLTFGFSDAVPAPAEFTVSFRATF